MEPVTMTVAATTAVKLISAGFCLGIGFWASKKLTNVIDEKLLMYDKRKLKQLEREMELNNELEASAA